MPLPKCRFGDSKYSAFMITAGPLRPGIEREEIGRCIETLLPDRNKNPWKMFIAMEQGTLTDDQTPGERSDGQYRHMHVVIEFEKTNRFSPRLVKGVKEQLLHTDDKGRKPNCQGNYVSVGEVPKGLTAYTYLVQYLKDPRKKKIVDDGAIEFEPTPSVDDQLRKVHREALQNGQDPRESCMIELHCMRLFQQMNGIKPMTVQEMGKHLRKRGLD